MALYRNRAGAGLERGCGELVTVGMRAGHGKEEVAWLDASAVVGDARDQAVAAQLGSGKAGFAQDLAQASRCRRSGKEVRARVGERAHDPGPAVAAGRGAPRLRSAAATLDGDTVAKLTTEPPLSARAKQRRSPAPFGLAIPDTAEP